MSAENLSTEITTTILSQVATILDHPLNFGSLTINVNFRSGIPDRFTVTRQESFMLTRQGEDK